MALPSPSVVTTGTVDGTPVDLVVQGVGGRPLPLVFRARVPVPPDVREPTLTLASVGGRATVQVDAQAPVSVGGIWHWRHPVVVPLEPASVADGEVQVEVVVSHAMQNWPHGAWLSPLVLQEGSTVPPSPESAQLGAELSLLGLLAMVGVVVGVLGVRRADRSLVEFGVGATAYGVGTGLWFAWALGVAPLPPLGATFTTVTSAVAFGAWAAVWIGLLAPEWRRARLIAPLSITGTGLLEVFGWPVAAEAAMLLDVVVIVATVVHAARTRRRQLVPLSLGLAPAGASMGVHVLVALDLGIPPVADVAAYLVALATMPVAVLGALAVRVVQAADAAERFVPREYLAAIGAVELSDARPGVRVERDLAVLFTDVRGFTALSERLPPAEVAEVVDRVLEVQADVVAAHGGFVDKYVGDALMALFPEPEGAAQAALACVRAVDALGVGVSIGAGVHRGPVQVGVVGSHRRLACTALGDAVNLASRVEGFTRVAGVGALATESVGDGGLPSRTVARVVVKGRDAPVRLLELGTPAPEGWEAAHEALGRGDPDAAHALFERLPDDPVARMLASRCREAREAGSSWDGVIRATSK